VPSACLSVGASTRSMHLQANLCCFFCCYHHPVMHPTTCSDWEASRRLLPPLASSLASPTHASASSHLPLLRLLLPSPCNKTPHHLIRLGSQPQAAAAPGQLPGLQQLQQLAGAARGPGPAPGGTRRQHTRPLQGCRAGGEGGTACAAAAILPVLGVKLAM
jgi:hypothetical protein